MTLTALFFQSTRKWIFKEGQQTIAQGNGMIDYSRAYRAYTAKGYSIKARTLG
jgi:hypothetical protein